MKEPITLQCVNCRNEFESYNPNTEYCDKCKQIRKTNNSRSKGYGGINGKPRSFGKYDNVSELWDSE